MNSTIYIVVGLIVLVSLLPVVRLVMRAQSNKALQTSGTPAQATIVSATQTGTFVNNNPQVALVLDVRPDGAPPFRAQAVQVVPLIAIAQIQPGAVVGVRYDPADPTKVALAQG
jgi:hypothetical protein